MADHIGKYMDIVEAAITDSDVRRVFKSAAGSEQRMYTKLMQLWADKYYANNTDDISKILSKAGVGMFKRRQIFKRLNIATGKKKGGMQEIVNLANAIKKTNLTPHVIDYLKKKHKIRESVVIEKVITDKDIKRLFVAVAQDPAVSETVRDYIKKLHSEISTSEPGEQLGLVKELVNYMSDRTGSKEYNEMVGTALKIVKQSGIPSNAKETAIADLKDGRAFTKPTVRTRDEPAPEPEEEPEKEPTRAKKDMSPNAVGQNPKDYIRQIDNKLQDTSVPIPVGTTVKGKDGNTYTWKGAQWINARNNRIIKKEVRNRVHEIGVKKAAYSTKLPYVKELVNYIADRQGQNDWDGMKDIAMSVIRKADLPDVIVKSALADLRNGSQFSKPKVKLEKKKLPDDLMLEQLFAKLIARRDLGRSMKR